MVPYPDSLDDVTKFSPELILLWARRTILYLEIEKMELEILELETTKANPEVEMEEIQIKRIDLLKDALASANEEKTVVIEKYE